MDIVKLKGTSWLAYDGGKGILIDTGMQTDKNAILKKIKALNISIPVIFITHAHIDHAGSLEEIRKATGARGMVSTKEADYLRQGRTPAPVGRGFFGNVISKGLHLFERKGRGQYIPVREDLIEIEQPQSLEEYGFDAQVFILGAHTEGSIELKIGDYFFAGDTVFNIGGAVYPLFAYCTAEIKTAWETILQSGATKICPGHGKIMDITRLENKYKNDFGKFCAL